ncbi:MAG: CampHawk [Neobacillus sp.]|nr:CampHawk [Neobacillus sp.]
MREVNKNIIIKQVVENTILATEESILIINENKGQKYIYVETAYIDQNGDQISTTNNKITGDLYDLLMSQSPDFAPNKPLNEYREVDLWYIIDQIRSQQS